MKTRGSFSDGVATYGSIPSVFSSDPKSPKCAERNISHKTQLAELYSENIVGKILRVARESLRDNDPPAVYPEIVPQNGPCKGQYQSREIDFWTCGFFPGCIYSLLERAIQYPESIQTEDKTIDLDALREELKRLGLIWSEPIRGQAVRTDTHDLGFMVMLHMRPRWELFQDEQALGTILTAAESLYTRFNTTVCAIRSWDSLDWHEGVSITDMTENFLVIIDSLCNLDLLYYAAAQSNRSHLADAATAHARTLLKSHLRAEKLTRAGYKGTLYSTRHVVNFSPKSGQIIEHRTAQGYHSTSTWSRGQAWAIIGYTQTYFWTKDADFLDAACGLAEYFLLRLENAPQCVETSVSGPVKGVVGRYVPLWDFDAPIKDPLNPLRDSSAGVAAADGMLMLSQALAGIGRHEASERYLQAALTIVEDTLNFALAEQKTLIRGSVDGELVVSDVDPSNSFHAIIKHATVNNNPSSLTRFKDHGLVYADYYLIAFGTRLLQSGLF